MPMFGRAVIEVSFAKDDTKPGLRPIGYIYIYIVVPKYGFQYILSGDLLSIGVLYHIYN